MNINRTESPFKWTGFRGAGHMERRLAAILAADVVGYSRLMGEDETGTLDAVRAHREELIEPKIAEHKSWRR